MTRKIILIILFYLNLHEKGFSVLNFQQVDAKYTMARESRNQSGGLHSLLLFFYPRDNTKLLTLSFSRRPLLVMALSFRNRSASKENLKTETLSNL